MAPQLVMRALPCHGDKIPGECEGCSMDVGSDAGRGTAVLRTSCALVAGGCSCYRLRVTNLTPLPTTVKWDAPIEKEDAIKVTFIPNDFDVGSYAQVEIRPINVPTAGAQAFPVDGIGRLGHDPPRGASSDLWVLTTADAAGTNGLTCLPTHGGARDSNFWSPIQ
ncbi:hypothetical protein evm_009100 [Chilo suppressalis]|nr:hypothetical protein evm_009100 [Chilo suppressalis]